MKLLAAALYRRWLRRRDYAEPMQSLLSSPLPANKPFRDSELVSLDIETTGLDPATAEVLSIGWVLVRHNRVAMDSAKRCIVQPETAVGDSAAVHGLTDTVCAGGLPLRQVLDQVVTALAGRSLLVHHAGLDKRLLDRVCRRHYGAPLAVPVVDTLALELRRRRRRAQSSKGDALRLVRLREHYKLPYYAGHDCLADALATAELLLAMIATHGSASSTRLAELL
ncbi:MAG: exonuclease domain-containing protein [Pseudomonadota bacterium]